MEWLPIETAPKDGTVVDLWMVEDGGRSYRVADAYFVRDNPDSQTRYADDGSRSIVSVQRDGWFAPNYGYEGVDDFCDEPRWYNADQKKWIWTEPTHWMPLPTPPSPP